jgi:hypothetical protein
MRADGRTDRDEAMFAFRSSETRQETSQLLLYMEIVAVCSEIHTKHINTLCGQNVEFLNDIAGGTYSDHCGLKGCGIYLNSTSLLFKEPVRTAQ